MWVHTDKLRHLSLAEAQLGAHRPDIAHIGDVERLGPVLDGHRSLSTSPAESRRWSSSSSDCATPVSNVSLLVASRHTGEVWYFNALKVKVVVIGDQTVAVVPERGFITLSSIIRNMKRALVLAVIVLLAGCGGQAAPATQTTATTETPTATATATPTPTATPAPPDNPFQSDPVVVAIENPTNRSFEPLVRSAAAYWNTNAGTYGEWSTTLIVRPNATDPDIRVRFIDDIVVCDSEIGGEFLGCAPVPEAINPGETAVIDIERGYTDASTLSTIKHEFGHVYGVTHGEEPMPLMNASSVANETAQPNATERAVPWQTNHIQVYVNYSSFDASRDRVSKQVSRTLRYFDEGQDSVPDRVRVTKTGNRSAAEIVVRARPLSDAASDGSFYGMSPDADRALEYYTNATITLDRGLEEENIGWHIGYWLDGGLSKGLLPPFDEPEEDSRGNWWQYA